MQFNVVFPVDAEASHGHRLRYEDKLLTLQLADKACLGLTRFIIPLVAVINPHIDARLLAVAVVRLFRMPVAVFH